MGTTHLTPHPTRLLARLPPHCHHSQLRPPLFSVAILLDNWNYKTYSLKIYCYTRKHHYSVTSQGACTIFSRLCVRYAALMQSRGKITVHKSTPSTLLMPTLRFPLPKSEGKLLSMLHPCGPPICAGSQTVMLCGVTAEDVEGGTQFVQAIIEDETTTHEQWLDVVHVCQVYGYHDGLTSQVCQV